MAVTFVGSSAAAATNLGLTISISIFTSIPDDVLVAAILCNDNQTITPVQSGWIKQVEADNTAAQRLTIFTRAYLSTDDAAFGGLLGFSRLSQPSMFMGAIMTFRGVNTVQHLVTPAPSVSLNAASLIVDYASYDPDEPCHIVAVGGHNNDVTDTSAATRTGIISSLARRLDVESTAGNNGSIFGWSNDWSAAPTGAGSHTTGPSSTAALNIGVLLGLKDASSPVAPTVFPVPLATQVPYASRKVVAY